MQCQYSTQCDWPAQWRVTYETTNMPVCNSHLDTLIAQVCEWLPWIPVDYEPVA